MTEHPPEPPHPITQPVMLNEWRDLAFIHWPYRPDVVQSLLPTGLDVETFDGQAWVGLVPFRMVVSHPRIGPLPWASHFLETNVRTYVRGPNGEVGVFFFSLEAERLGAVLVGRGVYGVPYFWTHMRARADGTRRTYVAQRRWPDGGARSTVEVEIGRPIPVAEVTAFEHYLTARWALFGVRPGGDHLRPRRASALAATPGTLACVPRRSPHGGRLARPDRGAGRSLVGRRPRTHRPAHHTLMRKAHLCDAGWATSFRQSS